MLTDAIAVNHLNCLLVFGSRSSYTLTVPPGYTIKYVGSARDFRTVAIQMAANIRLNHLQANEDINRVRIGMEDVPVRLRKLVLELKYDNLENIKSTFPDQFKEVEKLVNNSLLVMHRSAQNFQNTLNYITELELVLTKNPADPSLDLELIDLRDQWRLFTELIVELSTRADRLRENFLLQLNWILNELVRTGFQVTDTHREFLIRLLLAKIVEIDQTCDLLKSISQVHEFMSETSVNEQISGHDEGINLATAVERKRALKVFRSSITPNIVRIVRRSMDKQDDFYRRDTIRRRNIEKILTTLSLDELNDLVHNPRVLTLLS